MFESGVVGWACLTVVVGFVFGGWDVPDGFEDPTVVVSVDPLQGGVLDVVEALPGSTPSDDLGLVQADDRLGESVVVAVTDRADRWFDPGFGEPFGVTDTEILRSPVRMVDEPLGVAVETGPDGLLEGVAGQVGAKRRRGPCRRRSSSSTRR